MGVRVVRSIRATSRDAAKHDDDDILIQLDLIPRTSTQRLELLRHRVQALLDPKGLVCTNIGSKGALAKYATRQKDAIDAELKMRQDKTQLMTEDDDDDEIIHPVYAQSTSCNVPLPSTSKTIYNEVPSSVSLVAKRRPRRRFPISETKSSGHTMLVGGGDGGMVERARRLAVAKKAEPIDEPLMLERRREERRQAAIERLRSRRQRRQQHKAARHDLQMSLHKQTSQTPLCSEHSRRRSEGSDSESVSDSDGDDELLRPSPRMTSMGTTESGATLEKKRGPPSETEQPASYFDLASDIKRKLSSLVDEACGKETIEHVKDTAAAMTETPRNHIVVTVPDDVSRGVTKKSTDGADADYCAQNELRATTLTDVASQREKAIIDECGRQQDHADLYVDCGRNSALAQVGNMIVNDAPGLLNETTPKAVNTNMSSGTTPTSEVIHDEPHTDVGSSIANDACNFFRNGNTPETVNTTMSSHTTHTSEAIHDEGQAEVGSLNTNDADAFLDGKELVKINVSSTHSGEVIQEGGAGAKPPSSGDSEGTRGDEKEKETEISQEEKDPSQFQRRVESTALEMEQENIDSSLVRCVIVTDADELKNEPKVSTDHVNTFQRVIASSEMCAPIKHEITRADPSTLCRRQSTRSKSTALSVVNAKCDVVEYQKAAPTKFPPPKTRYEKIHPFWWSIFSQWSMLHFATDSHQNKRNARKRPPPGDVQLAMNRQWRLYTVYETIMTDYAAVFSSADHSRAVYDGNSAALHFRVNSSRPEVFDIVTHVLTHDIAFASEEERWIELPAGLGLKTTWNLLWTWSKPRIDYSHLLAWQRVNHYPKSRQLTRKDLLARSIAKFANLVKLAPDATSRRLEGAFDVTPATFLLPQDYCALVQASRADSCTLWIVKPVGLSRGRGISLVADIEDVTYAEPVVVQEYLSRPLLLEGHKFDLRLYVLVTSFSPLEAFIYRRGFARLATRPFSLNKTSDKFVHLTNASVQKRAACGGAVYPLRFASVDEAGGTKCSLEYVWQRLRETSKADLDVDQIWRDICMLVLKSLVCVEDDIPHQPNSFEVFGYDVLIDADLRPWLLEVNASPSMARESNLDCVIKEAMIRDTVALVDPLRYDRAALVRILDRRLRAIENQPCSSSLSEDALLRSSLDADLNAILVGASPRPYGRPPRRAGDYEMLAPGRLHDQVCKIKRAIVRQLF